MKLRVIVIVAMFAATVLTSSLPRASATPITISSIDPASGAVGTIVRVIGEIDTLGGSYQIWWDYGTLLKEGNCTSTSYAVDDTFTVPSTSEGVHTIILYDNTASTESTSMEFYVTPPLSYTLSFEPSRIQEGLNTTITVVVEGAAANKNFLLTMIVTAPTTISHTAALTVTTDNIGSGNVSRSYWEKFPGTNTNFVGTYSVTVNGSLATGGFTVGLTDKAVYQAMEIVYIRGSGYNPNENVTVNIKLGGTSVAGYPKNVTADMKGVVTDPWSIPNDAEAGNYVVTLVNASTLGTVKEPADVQEFKVRAVYQIQTQNLDNEAVAGITVEAYNATTGDFLASETANKTGWVTFFLERDYYTFKVFWKNVEVGSLSNQSVSGTLTRILEVPLAHISIMVKDETDTALPLINLVLAYNYTTRYGEMLSGTFPLETNSTGIAEVYNTFADISYAVEARRNSYLFSRTFIENLASSIQVNITCPSYNLFINVLDSKGKPLGNVQVAVYESSSGSSIGMPRTTNSSGSTDFRLLLGRYRVSVYNYSSELGVTIVLNETSINLIEDLFLPVQCRIFNIDLSVRVVDYFGQPIPNAIMKFERNGITIAENSIAGSNGVSLLQNVIGGDYRISVYIGRGIAGIQTFSVDRPMEILFKLGGYAEIGGHPLEISQFITLISMSLLSISFVLMLARRRLLLFARRIGEAVSSKVKKGEKEKEEQEEDQGKDEKVREVRREEIEGKAREKEQEQQRRGKKGRKGRKR